MSNKASRLRDFFDKAVILFLVIALVWAIGHHLGFLGGDDRLEKGMALPDVKLVPVDEQGGLLSLTELRGKGVLINFFATWCGPCKAEMPILQRIYDRYGGEHFTVIGVSDEAPATVASFLRNLPSDKSVTYPAYWDSGGELGRALKVDRIPFTVFLGPDGTVQGDVTGEISYNEAESRVLKLIELAKRFEPELAGGR